MRYTSGDNLKLMDYSPSIDGVELQHPVFPNGFPIKKNVAAQGTTRKRNIICGIEACNEVLDGYGDIVGPALKHECLGICAALLLKVYGVPTWMGNSMTFGKAQLVLQLFLHTKSAVMFCDAIARLYDRRMLCYHLSAPVGRECHHLLASIIFARCIFSDSGHPSLHLTHVTFSPSGDEVLLSHSGEHVYLMNVYHAGENTMQYTSGDNLK